jgi:hypothetical protein
MTVSGNSQQKPASIEGVMPSSQSGKREKIEVCAQQMFESASFDNSQPVLSSKITSLLRRDDTSSPSSSQKKLRTGSADQHHSKEEQILSSSSKKPSLTRREETSSSSSRKKLRASSADVHHCNVKEVAKKIEKLTQEYFHFTKYKEQVLSHYGAMIKHAEEIRKLLPSIYPPSSCQTELDSYKQKLKILDEKIKTEIQKFDDMSDGELSTLNWQELLDGALQAKSLHIIYFMAKHIKAHKKNEGGMEFTSLEVFKNPIEKQTINKLLQLLVSDERYWDLLDHYVFNIGRVPLELILDDLMIVSGYRKHWVLYLSTRIEIVKKGSSVNLKVLGISLGASYNVKGFYRLLCVSLIQLSIDKSDKAYAPFLEKLLEIDNWLIGTKKGIRKVLNRVEILKRIEDTQILSLLIKNKIPTNGKLLNCQKDFIDKAISNGNFELFELALRLERCYELQTYSFIDKFHLEKEISKLLTILTSIEYVSDLCKKETLSDFCKNLISKIFPESEENQIIALLKKTVEENQIDLNEIFDLRLEAFVSYDAKIHSFKTFIKLGYKIAPSQTKLKEKFIRWVSSFDSFERLDENEKLEKLEKIDLGQKLGITPFQIADFYLKNKEISPSEVLFMTNLIGKGQNPFIISLPGEQKKILKSFLEMLRTELKPLASFRNPKFEVNLQDFLVSRIKLLLVFFDGHTQKEIFQDLFLNILETAEFYGFDLQFKVAESLYTQFKNQLVANQFDSYKVFAFLSEKYPTRRFKSMGELLSRDELLSILIKFFEVSSVKERSNLFLKSRETVLWIPNYDHLKKETELCSLQKKEEIAKLNFCKMMNHLWMQLFGSLPELDKSGVNLNVSSNFKKDPSALLSSDQIDQVTAIAQVPKNELSKKWATIRDQIVGRKEALATPQKDSSEEVFNKYYDGVEFYLKLYLSYIIQPDGTIPDKEKAFNYVSNLLNSSKVCATGWRDLAYEVCLQNSGKGSEVSQLIFKTLQSLRKKILEQWAISQNRWGSGNLPHVIADLLRVHSFLGIPGSENLVEEQRFIEKIDSDRFLQWFCERYNAGEIIQTIEKAIGDNTISNQKVADFMINHKVDTLRKIWYPKYIDALITSFKKSELIGFVQKEDTSARDRVDLIADQMCVKMVSLLSSNMRAQLTEKQSLKENLKVDIKNAIMNYWKHGSTKDNAQQIFYNDLFKGVFKIYELINCSLLRKDLYDSETYNIKRCYIAKLLQYNGVIMPSNNNKSPPYEDLSSSTWELHKKIVGHFYASSSLYFRGISLIELA